MNKADKLAERTLEKKTASPGQKIDRPIDGDKVVARALQLGKKMLPGAELVVSLHDGRSAHTRFACSELTTSGDVDTTEISVQAHFGRRHASASGNQTSDEGLQQLLVRVGQLGRIAPEDKEHMPLLPPQRYLEVPSAYDDATARLTAKERGEAVRSAISQGDAQKLQVAGFYEHLSERWTLGSSTGLRGRYQHTEASFTTTARTPDGSGSGWASAISQRSAEIDATALAKVAIDKAVRAQKPKNLAPGRYTVILEPAAVGELLSFLLSALDARSADEGRSFFAKPGGGNRVGEKLFSDLVTLRADPTDKATPGAPFSEEGLPQKPRSYVEKGAVTNLWYSRYWADKQQKEPTGRPRVAHLLPGQTPVAAMLDGVKRGVLITRFWYCRWVDPQSMLVTGLTRDGVFLVENGQVTAPVNNFRFNESPATLLKNADALSDRTIIVSGDDRLIRVPTIRSHEFNLASVSEAV